MSWSSLIIGLIIGWAIEWVIDWLYWRQRGTDGSAELDNLRAQNKRLRADLDAAAGPVGQLKADLATANSQLAASHAENEALRAQAPATPAALAATDTNAELQRLHARRIVEHGQAAFLSDKLAQLQLEHGQPQAQTASSAPSTNEFATQQLSAAEVNAALELEQLRIENRQLQTRLTTAAPAANTFATQQLSAAEVNAALAQEQARVDGVQTLSRSVGESDDSARLRGDLDDAHSQIAQLRAELAGMRAQGTNDPLIDINGIGPVIEKRLFEAGIFTFAQLAAESPSRLREIARIKEWQDADPNAWIAEARERAAQQSGS